MKINQSPPSEKYFEMEYGGVYALLMSVNLSITLIIILAACLCCRRKVPKNEFLGLEGMVKIKNPEENIENNLELNDTEVIPPTKSGADADLRRASNAPHRSLPDIPIVESLNDNGSELYATVADKVNEKPQGRSPTPSLKKQTSVSQHSSISQADDISSPYARVKTPPHEYDKVLPTEHPYAQLNSPRQNKSTSTNYKKIEDTTQETTLRETNQNSLNTSCNNIGTIDSSQHQQQEIPAASAIAGMVSASQELPYMTPPIIQQPHFSGDSQDSSKGYTSISVREPLANILAQTSRPQNRMLTKDINDPHYATVSDDSDEMYAAIEDPNNVYTSGSETYAQIQPSTTAITVAVEINIPSTSTSRINEQIERNFEPISSSSLLLGNKLKTANNTPIPPPVDSLRAAKHSRQASSSSNTSSVGILGSPKPEKRQANSPLPPTPKNSQFIHHSTSNLTTASSNSMPSGRNSVASVIECQQHQHQLPSTLSSSGLIQSKEYMNTVETDGNNPLIATGNKNFSPSKDIEGMYAKVMKKNKFSNSPSQNSSPVMGRKLTVETSSNILSSSPSDHMKEYVLNAIQASPGKNSIKSAYYLDNSYETIDNKRPRSNSYDNKDHGYETIPGDKNTPNNNNNNLSGNRKSDGYAQILQKERHKCKEELPTNIIFGVDNAPIKVFVGPEITQRQRNDTLTSSEPGYESLPDQSQNLISDHGYEVLVKNTTTKDNDRQTTTNSDYDPNYEVLRPSAAAYSGGSDDGYARVVEKTITISTDDGYSRVKERDEDDDQLLMASTNHDYASILEANFRKKNNNNTNNIYNNNNDEISSDVYSSIPNSIKDGYHHNYQTICDIKSTITATAVVSTNSITKTERLSIAASPTPSSTEQNSPATDIYSNSNMKYSSSTSNTLSGATQRHSPNSSNNYESLTGSESDPNYESVKYSKSTENPYERLHDDFNISPDIPSSSDGITNSTPPSPMTGTTTSATNHNIPKTSSISSTNHQNSNSSKIENGDYYEV